MVEQKVVMVVAGVESARLARVSSPAGGKLGVPCSDRAGDGHEVKGRVGRGVALSEGDCVGIFSPHNSRDIGTPYSN